MRATTPKSPVSEDRDDRKMRLAKIIQKILAVATFASILLVFQFREMSIHEVSALGDGFYFPAKDYFVYDNLMHTALILAVVFLFILFGVQKGKFFPYMSKKEKRALDEREVTARLHALSTSYTIFFVGSIFASWIQPFGDLKEMPMHFSMGGYHFPMYALMALFVGLPSLLAAFDRNV